MGIKRPFPGAVAGVGLLFQGLRVLAGTCAMRQSCFQTSTDTLCTPTVFSPGQNNASFPMDAAHGYGIVHDTVWDGTVADAGTGSCLNGGIPDDEGHCIIDFPTPKGLDPIAPIICPRYQDDTCCTWQQNYALYQNLKLLVDSFGSATGCLACAVNLVNFWCQLSCAPDSDSFITLHDPPYVHHEDDLTGETALVLEADAVVEPSYACRIYDSCRSTAIVGETTAMQSGSGLLLFQTQTGAVGHGLYMSLTFDQISGKTPMNQSTLECSSFFDPGSSTIPFPYPPPEQRLTSCSCDYCSAACSSGDGPGDVIIHSRPIPVMNGFRYGLVGAVYATVLVASTALAWGRSAYRAGLCARGRGPGRRVTEMNQHWQGL